ncbi:TonB-linked SusC/RagA family outer membrane protein [Catalinimonas alkaloidigena]|uniref:SusC/RagA family TonB-linked outer membrane protein n=1 Tax=Catalinimonas alkaloidigena TaxID=1075417 RepID=UPI002405E6A7|nr:SusC/RagA family TonB-linked outer membrane protein [Catalinimonas alkaloidigena]MDF9795408.1 TonB-linked SusC/RagA family outer membrane protein [Catalinimonas alkaloidigena]
MRKVLLIYFVLLSTFQLYAQERIISGKVSSEEDDSPIPGANIIVKGTTTGTLTDISGSYSLSVPEDASTLVFSFIGMTTMEVDINGQSEIDIQLATDAKELSEVVVTALGERVDRDELGTAITSVEGQKIAESGETSALTGLSGKAAGVQITRSGGDPGAGAFIQIRGQNTINGLSQPLIVIDGIPMSNSSEGSEEVMQQSRLNDLNPADIASMEILKGASAAALWGTRAANGVIMITTKQGEDTEGKVNIDFSSTFSIDKINKLHPIQSSYGQGTGGMYDMFTTRSWGDKIADRSGGEDVYITDPNDPAYAGYVTFPDGTRKYVIPGGTEENPHGGKNSQFIDDHTNDVFRTGYYTDNNLAVSGGNTNTNFYLSLANLNQKGIIEGNSDYVKNSIRFNVNSNLTDWLTVRVNSNYISMNSNRVQQGDNVNGLLLGMLRTPPDFNNDYDVGDYTDPAGNTYVDRHIAFRNPLGISDNPGFSNPVWNVHNIDNTTNVDRILGNVELSINPTDWLSITGRSGIDNFVDKRVYDFPIYSAANTTGELTQQYITERQFNNDLFARVTKQVSSSLSVRALVGANYNSRYYENVDVSLNNFIIPDAPPLLNNALNSNLSAENETRLIRTYAYYAQLNFDIMNMLYLEFTGRNESASTFGTQAENSFFFPSASMAWQFTNLPGFPEASFLSFGKLRASYGEVGIQPRPYLTTTPFNLANYNVPYASNLIGSSDNYQGAYIRDYTSGNFGLKPERKAEFEIGTDLRFFNDRLNLSATYYKNDTRDVIMELTTSPSTGFTSSWENAAHLQNKGVEIELGYDIFSRPNFSWNIAGNYSFNRNEVISLAGSDAQEIGYRSAIIEGQPFGVFYGVDFAKDENGNYALDENGFPTVGTSNEVLGNPNPAWQAGLNNAFRFKNITFSFLFSGVFGNDIWSGARGALFNYGTHALIGKERVSDVDLVTNTGVVIPAGTPFRGNIGDFGGGPVALTETWYNGGGGGAFDGASDGQFVFDGSHIRLRQVSLSYTLNTPGFRDFTKLSSVEIGFTGRNLGLWTDYIGVDPESNQTQADSQARGEDWFVNPSTKSYIFSIRISY